MCAHTQKEVNSVCALSTNSNIQNQTGFSRLKIREHVNHELVQNFILQLQFLSLFNGKINSTCQVVCVSLSTLFKEGTTGYKLKVVINLQVEKMVVIMAP